MSNARSGEDALRLREEKYDLVLLDMNMPGMGGMAACRAIREQWDVAIVVLTVRTRKKTRSRRWMRAPTIMSKPFGVRNCWRASAPP